MYVVSYFTDADEALHLAYSHDGEKFAAVNGGRPVLRGTVGTGELRDPFIGVGPDGLFHLLATDGWTSPSIVHATSADLLTWSEQELIPVMAAVEGARNAWAPEFFLDRATGLYHLIWSSVVDAGSTAEGRDYEHISQDHRIWHCTTEDFRTFSAPEVFFDPGHSVIDATVRELDGGGFLMAFKDERGTNDLATAHKDIHLTTFDTPGGPYASPGGRSRPRVEGPSIFRRGDELVMIFDHFLEGQVRGGPQQGRRRVGARLPGAAARMRHASVLERPSRRRSPRTERRPRIPGVSASGPARCRKTRVAARDAGDTSPSKERRNEASQNGPPRSQGVPRPHPPRHTGGSPSSSRPPPPWRQAPTSLRRLLGRDQRQRHPGQPLELRHRRQQHHLRRGRQHPLRHRYHLQRPAHPAGIGRLRQPHHHGRLRHRRQAGHQRGRCHRPGHPPGQPAVLGDRRPGNHQLRGLSRLPLGVLAENSSGGILHHIRVHDMYIHDISGWPAGSTSPTRAWASRPTTAPPSPPGTTSWSRTTPSTTSTASRSPSPPTKTASDTGLTTNAVIRDNTMTYDGADDILVVKGDGALIEATRPATEG